MGKSMTAPDLQARKGGGQRISMVTC